MKYGTRLEFYGILLALIEVGEKDSEAFKSKMKKHRETFGVKEVDPRMLDPIGRAIYAGVESPAHAPRILVAFEKAWEYYQAESSK